MQSNARPSQSPAAQASPAPAAGSSSFRTSSTGYLIGELLARVVVPLWVLAGALMKLQARDARLLPQPIIDLVAELGKGFMEERNHVWLLDATLRTLIGIELALVVAMVFAPRIARLAAGFTLSVFLLVLAVVMWNDFGKGGFGLMLSGSCGCLGTNSPPPPLMFLIDAALLAGIVIFPIRLGTPPSGPRIVPILLTGGMILAFTVAAMTPPKVLRIVLPPEPHLDSETDIGTDHASGPAASSAQMPSHWPAPPEVSPMYFPQVASWTGRRMSEIDLLQQMRPAPAAQLLTGVSYVVIYRGDCGNCHDLLAVLMSGERAQRTIALRIAEGDPAADKPMPSDQFRLHMLPEGPTYVVTTPVLAVIRDGVIASASAAVDLESAEAMLTSVEQAVVPDAAAAQPTPTPSAETPTDPPAEPAPAAAQAAPSVTPGGAPAIRPWPARPAVEALYWPQFENWIGRRIDEHPMALQIQRPVGLNRGRWHVIFYRGDCEHCHQMMEIYLLGEAEPMIVAVRVPDTDPASDLGMPLTDAVFRTLPEGPNYVIQTPVLLTIVDGVILAMATDPDDPDSVMAALTADAPTPTPQP